MKNNNLKNPQATHHIYNQRERTENRKYAKERRIEKERKEYVGNSDVRE